MKKTLLIALLLYQGLLLSAQDKISRLSYSIADTSQSQTEQAHALYTWITHNIAYDVQQLNQGPKDYTPQQTLNRRKAVCYGYSELYHALCDALGIESYVIIGYCKGFGYVRGEDFSRSNHSWNVVYADSSWILLDPTWGSGALAYRYNLKNRLKKIFNKNAAIKTEAVFIKNPTDKYFNMALDEMLVTHFPADSKWQFKEYPVSYHEFITDTSEKVAPLDFQRELAQIRLKDMDEQLFIDAKNSPRYNAYNEFDIAYQYFHQANQLEIKRKMVMDSVLLKKLKLSGNYYGIAINHLKQYRNIRRSFYREKKLSLKTNFRRAGRSIKTISKIPTEQNEKYFKVYGKYVRQEGMLKKSRLDRFNAEVKIPLNAEYAFDTVNQIDTLLLTSYLQSFRADSLEAEKYFSLMRKKQQDMEDILEAGRFHNDTILYCVTEIRDALQTTRLAITNMDEYELNAVSLKLNTLQHDHAHWTAAKENIQGMLLMELENLRKLSQRVERSLMSSLRTLEKLARLTGENEKYTRKTREIYQLLHTLYQEEMLAIGLVKENNDSWLVLLTGQNNILSGCGTKGLPEVSRQVSAFYNYAIARNDTQYKTDMKLYDQILTYSKQRLKIIKSKIREVNKVLNTAAKTGNSS